ncbi:hypothetical protein P872_04905 [Rhodonellum psychrophilum GCM71 = DSM 17998]|uniref:Uncharacterized protein n=1 Tax=Rhodonellum psychrophilum GCM71 = DSM 17998 TaxID=1123057 RepID=U5BQU8_9BACT|nr:hypothetical protein P872_04905 [Rhodonellum psychrophilum GCM71 = DSM 17998]
MMEQNAFEMNFEFINIECIPESSLRKRDFGDSV